MAAAAVGSTHWLPLQRLVRLLVMAAAPVAVGLAVPKVAVLPMSHQHPLLRVCRLLWHRLLLRYRRAGGAPWAWSDTYPARPQADWVSMLAASQLVSLRLAFPFLHLVRWAVLSVWLQLGHPDVT